MKLTTRLSRPELDSSFTMRKLWPSALFGSGGSAQFGAGTKGRVSRCMTYGDVTINFAVDLDANTATIGETVVALDGVNTVLVDYVDKPGSAAISATQWVDPRLPLSGDVHVALILRSRALLDLSAMQRADAAGAVDTVVHAAGARCDGVREADVEVASAP